MNITLVVTLFLFLSGFVAGPHSLNQSVAQAAQAPVATPKSNAVIFAYQRFGNRSQAKYVSPERFEQQLDYLQKNGFRIWPLRRIVRRLYTGQPIPDGTVAITIDDTHHSVYDIAYPILKARKIPFTVFVVPDRVDQIPAGNISWEQMREMKSHGAEFANHSSNHIHLVRPLKGYPQRAWLHYVRDNILNAQTRIQEQLGTDTNRETPLFSYPYGEYSAQLADIIVGDLGYAALGQHPGAIHQGSDLRALPRFLIGRNSSDIKSFTRKAHSIALPATVRKPWEPKLGSNNPPSLEVDIAKSAPSPGYLGCYTLEGRKVAIQWKGRGHHNFSLQAQHSLPRGYNYYQCLGRYPDSERYYWFSQPWIVNHHKEKAQTEEEQLKQLQAEEESKEKDVANETPEVTEPKPN